MKTIFLTLALLLGAVAVPGPTCTPDTCTVSLPAAPAVPYGRIQGEIDEEVATKTADFLRKAEADEAGAVILEINTPGGSVDAGFHISKAIEESKVPVYCIVDGMAASMGMYILQSCDIRVMTDRSTLMWHTPSVRGMFGGDIEAWKVGASRVIGRLEVLQKAMNRHVARRLNLTPAQVQARVGHGREWWMESEGAVQVQAVDVVVQSVLQLRAQVMKKVQELSVKKEVDSISRP